MITAIKYRNTAENRLAKIDEDASYWRQELDNLVNIIKSYKVASFYETALTKRLIMASVPLLARVLRLTIIELRRFLCPLWRVYNGPSYT